MESTRGEGDATPESENSNPSKKRRTDSLLLEIEERNLKGFMELMSQGVDVKSTGNFSLNDTQQFEDVPPLFAAIITDQQEMIEGLINQYPHFDLDANQELTLHATTNREQRIDSLELVGAALILQGDVGAQNHGLDCWKYAMKLRFVLSSSPLPKDITLLSHFESRALNYRREIRTALGLEELLWEKTTEWKKQAYLTSRRILTKYGCFPNLFVVENLYRYFLKHRRASGLDSSRVYATILFLLEILHDRPTTCYPFKGIFLIVAIIRELEEVLQNLRWLQFKFIKEDPMLTFENLMFSLRFVCRYLETIQEFFPKRFPDRKRELMELTTDVIIAIGKILLSLPLTQAQRATLEDGLEKHLLVYERRWSNDQPNLLLKLSTKHRMQYNQEAELLMIEALIKAGANPNIKDSQRNTVLHHLSRTECEDHSHWRSPTYFAHAKAFTAAVKAILTESFHEDQRNIYGRTALQPFKDTSSEYPNAEFCNVLDEYFRCIRSLSCLSAIRVRELGLSYHDLPKTVQVLISLH